jgi:hypothetical protein
MRRPSLLAGVTMAAILGLSLATVFMPAIAGEPSAGPGPVARLRGLQAQPLQPLAAPCLAPCYHAFELRRRGAVARR